MRGIYGVDVVGSASGGYYVDVESLSETAEAVRAVAEEQRERHLSELVADTGVYGDEAVHGAFAEFCSRWNTGMDVLTKDAHRIADALAQVVSVYRLAEERNEDLTSDKGTVE